MASYTTADIRNIALVGHAGAGKTSLAERLLHDSGVLGRLGSVEDKNTVCDYEDEEKHHGHSLSSAVVHFDHNGKRYNLIDTPGAPDFLGAAIPALPAVETAFVVIDATRGVQTVTRRIMSICAERRLPRMIVINKIDAATPDQLDELVEHIRETFGNECLPANLPAGGGERVVNVIDAEDGETDFSSVSDAHTNILDQIVEIDDSLMEGYLETGTVEKKDLHDAFEKALREAHLVPILFVSSRTGAGAKELLEFTAGWAPSPLEGNPRPFQARTGENAEEEEWHAEPNPERHAVAHVFKVTSDPFVGKLAVFRVHQGTVKANSQLQVNDEKKPIRIGHLLMLRGKEHEETDRAIPGDIVAVAKVEELKGNDVLHEPSIYSGLHLRALPVPQPMMGLAIEPKSRGDEAKLSGASRSSASRPPTRPSRAASAICTCASCSSASRTALASKSRPRPRRSPTRRPSPARPRGTTATRSRPAAPGSSARSSSASSPSPRTTRTASSSWTTPSAAPSPSSFCPPSRRASAPSSMAAPSPATR